MGVQRERDHAVGLPLLVWDVDRWPAKFPYVFEQFYFYQFTACHLRQRIPPALTVTDARS